METDRPVQITPETLSSSDNLLKQKGIYIPCTNIMVLATLHACAQLHVHRYMYMYLY